MTQAVDRNHLPEGAVLVEGRATRCLGQNTGGYLLAVVLGHETRAYFVAGNTPCSNGSQEVAPRDLNRLIQPIVTRDGQKVWPLVWLAVRDPGPAPPEAVAVALDPLHIEVEP